MAININNLGNNPPVNNKVEQQNQVKQQAAQTSVNAAQAKAVQQDSVSITPQAKQFTELQKKAAEGPMIDAKKIEKLKKAISDGEYKVDAQKLAKSMMSFEYDLFEK